MKTRADRHDDGRKKRRRISSLSRFRDELDLMNEDQLQGMVDAPGDYVNDVFNQFDIEQGSGMGKAHLICEDELAEAEGLVAKSAFLELAEESVRMKLQESFEGTGFSEKDCPWLKHLFRHYGRRSAKYLEHSIHKYLPGTQQAESVEDYIGPLGEKVQRAIAAWLKTGQITEVPTEIPRSLMRVAGQDAANQRARMGKGKELDSGTKSKMQGALGANVGDVRVHTEKEGNSFAKELDAQAATIGNDIAFADNKYKPGTPEGDALIAHELAHVLQQQGAVETGEMGSGADYAAMEQDAEGATRGFLGKLWGGVKNSFADLKANAWPRLRSGLQVQRCKQEESNDSQFSYYQAPHEPDVTMDPVSLRKGQEHVESINLKWSGDPFTISFKYDRENDIETWTVVVEYTGPYGLYSIFPAEQFPDVVNKRKEVSFSLSTLTQYYQKKPVFKPSIYEIKEDVVTIDMFGERSLMTTITNKTTIDDRGNNVVVRDHSLSIYTGSFGQFMDFEVLAPDPKIEPNEVEEFKSKDTINENLPAGISLKTTTLSFTMPKGKTLKKSEDPSFEIQTTSDTQVSIGVTAEGVSISFMPPLMVDVGPAIAKDVLWQSSFYSFKTAEASSILENNDLIGIGTKGQIEAGIKEFFESTVKDTRFGRKDYNPYDDPILFDTMLELSAKFQSSSSDASQPEISADKQLNPTEFTNVSLMFDFEMTDEYLQMKDKNGIKLRKGSKMSVVINIQDDFMKNSFDRSSLKIKNIEITSDGLVVIVNDKEKMEILDMELLYGNTIHVKQVKDLTGLGAAESLIRILILMGKLEEAGPTRAREVLGSQDIDSLDPIYTETFEKVLLELGIQVFILDKLQDELGSYMGIDLKQVLGITK